MIDFEQFKTKAEKYLRAHLPKESYYQDKIIKKKIKYIVLHVVDGRKLVEVETEI